MICVRLFRDNDTGGGGKETADSQGTDQVHQPASITSAHAAALIVLNTALSLKLHDRASHISGYYSYRRDGLTTSL